MTTQQKISYNWLDYTRALGIFWVVLGHTPSGEGLIHWIYLFHMPLFFWISGFLFDATRYARAKDFVATKAKQLLFPYLIFGIVLFLFWWVRGAPFSGEERPVYQPLLDMLYFDGTKMERCGPLWFLPVLFFAELLYFSLQRLKTPTYYIVLILALLSSVIHFFAPTLSVNILGICVWAFFYACWVAIKKPLQLLLDRINWYNAAIVALMLIAATVLSAYLVGRVDMKAQEYGFSLALFCVVSLMGIGLSVFVGVLLSKIRSHIAFITYISRNTLVILLLHGMVGTLLKGVWVFVFKQPVGFFAGNNLANICFALVSIVLLLPVIYLINRYIPWSLGKFNSR